MRAEAEAADVEAGAEVAHEEEVDSPGARHAEGVGFRVERVRRQVHRSTEVLP